MSNERCPNITMVNVKWHNNARIRRNKWQLNMFFKRFNSLQTMSHYVGCKTLLLVKKINEAKRGSKIQYITWHHGSVVGSKVIPYNNN